MTHCEQKTNGGANSYFEVLGEKASHKKAN